MLTDSQIISLRTYLRDKKITSMAFAELIGVTPNTISRYLNKVAEPSITVKKLIAYETKGKVKFE